MSDVRYISRIDGSSFQDASMHQHAESARHRLPPSMMRDGDVVRVLEIDLNSCRDVDATPIEQHHERLWQYHFEEYRRLTGREPREHALTAEDVARLSTTAREWMRSSPDDESANRNLWQLLRSLLAAGKLGRSLPEPER